MQHIRPLFSDACLSPEGDLWLAVGGPSAPGALLVSRDGGRSFQETTRQNPRDPDAHHFYSVFALDNRHVWACGAMGEDDTGVIWRSDDGGRYWEVLMAGDRARGLAPEAMYTQGVFLDAHHGFIVCAGDSLLSSDDGGRSYRPHPIRGARPFGLYFHDDRLGWLVSHDLDAREIPLRTRLFVTTDGGASWRPRDDDFAGLPALDIAACLFDPDGGAVLCGPEGLLLYCRPDDARWRFSRSPASVDLNFLARAPDGSLWVAGARGTLMVSRNDGRSFDAVHTGTSAELHAIAFVAGVGLVLGARGVALRFDPRVGGSASRCPSPWP